MCKLTLLIELRPELQRTAFSEGYDHLSNGFKQDFGDCVRETHATWMLNHHAFSATGGYTGGDLERARAASAGMGYNLHIDRIERSSETSVEAVIVNTGVAPIYFAASAELSCDNRTFISAPGLGDLTPGVERMVVFEPVPPTSACLRDVELR